MSSAFDKLKAAAKKAKEGNTKSYGDGHTYYYPTRDASGNGSAVIRFLPAVTDDDLPWAKVYSHGFKSPTGKWFIEECPTTIDGSCPVCEANGELWNTGIEANKQTVRERKRKLNYIANIYVVSDPKTPENEGKVFLFKFGTKIFDKIMSALDPEFEDETACNVFDPLEGANFKFRIRKVEGQTNYDKSEFEDSIPLGSKSEIKAALDAAIDLKQFTDPTKFKSHDDLKRKLDSVLGNTVKFDTAKTQTSVLDDDFDETQDIPADPPKKQSKPASKVVDEDDDDIDALMKRIAEED